MDFIKPKSQTNNQQPQNVGNFSFPNHSPQNYYGQNFQQIDNQSQQYSLNNNPNQISQYNQNQQNYNNQQQFNQYNPYIQPQNNIQPQSNIQPQNNSENIQSYQENLLKNRTKYNENYNKLNLEQNYNQYQMQNNQYYNPTVNQNYIPNKYDNNYRSQNQFLNNYRQDRLDFENNNYINDNNYQNYYQNDLNLPSKYFDPYNNSYLQNNNMDYQQQYNRPIYLDNYNNYNDQMQYGYEEFSNINQFHNNYQNMNFNNVNYAPSSSNNYNPYRIDNTYKKRLKEASIIPKEIGREIKSEKLRVFLLFVVGLVGILTTSLMLAVYYKTDDSISKFIGLKKEQVMYPFFSILLLIISVGFFGISLTDFTLLFSNVKKYERDLLMGNESIPYFITRNYKALISRSIYINWICFSTYIFGSIVLGILYTLQTQAGKTAYVLFWTIGTLKTLESEITVNIIVLLVALLVHVVNIISTRNRKNNIISYYGYEIIPEQEIKNIKKRANKICIIIFCIVILLLLFVILIPWLIIRRKKGQSLKPWKFGQ
ncbi:hypothetical protein STURON_00802 [Spiroplasma turonicum]|uniref:Transmembrane protein n=2 Tax=Spiroplasma turonicum TaxID=216946 RepID=A0A0K1P6X4_9MOLU|nr:hypothetical protein STURON_00802 [Spiroplasma turonicum]